MNLRQLTYFQKIAELRSFTRAANVLHIAQPSLSRQIQQLESELGVLLFVRSDKGAMPTEAGMALQERANAVLQLAECGNHVTPVVEADSSRLLCELVANGQGCTVLPFSAVYEASRDGRVKLRETISEVARRQIAEGLWRGAVALD